MPRLEDVPDDDEGYGARVHGSHGKLLVAVPVVTIQHHTGDVDGNCYSEEETAEEVENLEKRIL